MVINEVTYRIGDFAYIKPEKESIPPHIFSVDKIWQQKDGTQVCNYQFKINIRINPFLANVPILYSSKHQETKDFKENFWVFRMYKIRTLARNG